MMNIVPVPGDNYLCKTTQLHWFNRKKQVKMTPMDEVNFNPLYRDKETSSRIHYTHEWLDVNIVVQLCILKLHFTPSFFFHPYLFSFILHHPRYATFISPSMILLFSPIHYSFFPSFFKLASLTKSLSFIPSLRLVLSLFALSAVLAYLQGS